MSRSIRLRRLWSCLLCCGLAAGLVGCKVGPVFREPAPPTTKTYRQDKTTTLSAGKRDESQHLVPGAALRQDWWSLFHSQQLDLTVQAAIAGNRNLIQARATLEQSQQVEVQAAGGLYPHLNLNASAERQRLNFATLGIKPNPLFPKYSEFNVFSIGPTVSYNLDIWGGTRRLIEERAAQAEYQGYQMAAAYLTLTGNAVTQAVTIASIRAQIAAADDIIANDRQNLDLVQRELQAGMATSIEVESARSQLENDQTFLPPLRQQLSAARNALSLLVGVAPGDWSPPDFDLDRMTLPTQLPIGLPSELVHRRPDILAAESQMKAANAAVGVATAQLYPNINLTGAYEQVATSVGNVFALQNNAWNIAAQLAAPLLHGGELTAQRNAALAADRATRAAYEQTVLQAFTQVATVLDALQHDAELIEAQHRALDAAQHSLDLTRTSYQGGNTGILLVLDAQRRYQQSRLGYVRAVQQRFLDTVQLFAAIGGGWRDWQKSQMPAQPPTSDPGQIVHQLFSP
jgi:NodT family efflux transporter outer membrane factor (OMF) lipoprotein